MEIFAKGEPWLGLLNLTFAMCWLAASIFKFRKAMRLDLESYEKRPLFSDDKSAALRPGDTVLMLPPLDGMTADQQTALIGSMKAMTEPARERGIEFIVIPDWGQKAIVVSRGIQAERADDEVARKENTDWLAGAYKKMREHDQAALAEFEARAEAACKERIDLVDLSSNHAHIAIVRSYDAATHTCMVEVPWRTGLIEVDVDYPQKSDPPILKAGMKVYMRFFPTIEGYVEPD